MPAKLAAAAFPSPFWLDAGEIPAGMVACLQCGRFAPRHLLTARGVCGDDCAPPPAQPRGRRPPRPAKRTPLPSAPPVLTAAEAALTVGATYAAILATLSPRQREVIELYHNAHLARRVVAALMGVTPARVSQISRGATAAFARKGIVIGRAPLTR